METLTKLFRKIPAPVLVILLWALAVLPNLTVRSFIWEEGTNAELARDILVRGNFLEPSIHGVRWGEKPSLLPWLIAFTARLTGGVDEWSARLPAMLSVLVTALLVFHITRRHASRPAALFAASSFMFCPLLLQKLTIAEPDTLITVLSFAALVIWWRGVETRAGLGHWLACGMLLAAAVMAKGPQPIAFFVLGVGCFTLLHRRWGDLPGLAFCLALPAIAVIAWAAAVYSPGDQTVWLSYMRLGQRIDPTAYLVERFRFSGQLLVELLPATLLLPFLANQWLKGRMGENTRLVEAMSCYAGIALLVLLLWPGARTRYAMPAAPAFAVTAGLAIDLIWRRSWMVSRLAAIIPAGLFAYQLVLVTVVMPMYSHLFGATRVAGLTIDRAISRAPAPVFNVEGPDSNQLFYVSHPVCWIKFGDVAALTPPAWLVAGRHKLPLIEAQNPGLVFSQPVQTTSGEELVAVRISPRPAP